MLRAHKFVVPRRKKCVAFWRTGAFGNARIWLGKFQWAKTAAEWTQRGSRLPEGEMRLVALVPPLPVRITAAGFRSMKGHPPCPPKPRNPPALRGKHDVGIVVSRDGGRNCCCRPARRRPDARLHARYAVVLRSPRRGGRAARPRRGGGGQDLLDRAAARRRHIPFLSGNTCAPNVGKYLPRRSVVAGLSTGRGRES